MKENCIFLVNNRLSITFSLPSFIFTFLFQNLIVSCLVSVPCSCVLSSYSEILYFLSLLTIVSKISIPATLILEVKGVSLDSASFGRFLGHIMCILCSKFYFDIFYKSMIIFYILTTYFNYIKRYRPLLLWTRWRITSHYQSKYLVAISEKLPNIPSVTISFSLWRYLIERKNE